MKLLLTDDDVDQLELRSLTLSNAGYEVCTALDERTALQLAAQQKPAVSVVDLRFPTEEAGLRLIRALKKFDHQLGVIVLTGSDPKRFETLPERALVEAVMTKGNASRQLLEHLMRRKLAVDGELLIQVKVLPRSSRSEVVELLADGSMKVRLMAIPEKGRANEELIELIADYFGVRKNAVELIAGETSQRKRLCIRTGQTT